MQDSKPREDDSDNLETRENSVYTDDYQTEDAFSQIPVLNEFVEEETQEISSVPPLPGRAEHVTPPEEAFPAIEKFKTLREPPKKQAKVRKNKKTGTGERTKIFEPLKGFLRLMAKVPLRSLASSIKKFSREVIFISLGTVLLSACLVILGFISLHV